MALYTPMPPETRVVCVLCERTYKLGDLKPQPDSVVRCPVCGAAVQAPDGKERRERWR